MFYFYAINIKNNNKVYKLRKNVVASIFLSQKIFDWHQRTIILLIPKKNGHHANSTSWIENYI